MSRRIRPEFTEAQAAALSAAATYAFSAYEGDEYQPPWLATLARADRELTKALQERPRRARRAS